MNLVSISVALFLWGVYCGPSEAESVIFSFRKNIYRFIENLGSATIHVDRINGSNDRDITLIVSRNRKMEQMITFGPRDNEAAITFDIKDDSIALEPFETFTWYLEMVTVTNGIILQPYNRTNITILDDDELLIGFAQSVSVFESENATLCITFDSNFSTNFNIDVRLLLNNNITFSNLTLSNPMFSNPYNSLPDFSIEAISTLHGPDSNLCFDVSITQNKLPEYEECFVAVISLPNSVSGRLMVEIAGGKDMAIVCIENDDRPVVTTESPATTGPTVSTNVVTSNPFGNTAVFVIAGIVVLFLVAVAIIVVVIAMALRNCHITGFQRDVKSATLSGVQLSNISAVEESHPYELSEVNRKPTISSVEAKIEEKHIDEDNAYYELYEVMRKPTTSFVEAMIKERHIEEDNVYYELSEVNRKHTISSVEAMIEERHTEEDNVYYELSEVIRKPTVEESHVYELSEVNRKSTMESMEEKSCNIYEDV